MYYILGEKINGARAQGRERREKEYQAVINDIVYEWDKHVHHNVSLLGYHFTPLDNNDLWESFIAEQAKRGVAELQEEITRKFKENVTLQFYGRSGATLAPSEWVSEYMGHIAFTQEGAGLYDDTNAYNRTRRAKKILAVLEYLNKRAGEMCRELVQEWDYFIKANAE